MLLLLLLVFDVHPRLLLLLLLPTAPTGPLILQISVRHRGDIAAHFGAHRCTECRFQHTVHSCTAHCAHCSTVCTAAERRYAGWVSHFLAMLYHTLIGTWTVCVLSKLHPAV